MKRYRRRPIEVEAMQLPPLSEDGAADAWQEIATWCGGHVIPSSQRGQTLHLTTVLGRMYAEEHDWIVRDAEGAFHALSAEGFARDYEPVDDDPAQRGRGAPLGAGATSERDRVQRPLHEKGPRRLGTSGPVTAEGG